MSPLGPAVFSCLSLLILWARPAAAHAPPQATGIFPTGTGSDARQWVRTNRGLIVRGAPTDEPRLLCSDAYGASASEVPPLLASPEGLVLASYDRGLLRIALDGCSAEPLEAPLGDRRVVDLAPAADGSRSFALLAPRDSQPGGVLVSADAGSTWTAAGEIPAFGTALRVAPSDPDRLYVTAQIETEAEAEAGEPQHELFVSSDGGTTFSRRPFTLSDSEVRAFVLAVDPLDHDRLFLRTLPGNSDVPERLLASDDAGETFSEVYSAPGPLALAVDGDTAWLGGRDGLFRSDDRGKTFEPVPDAPTHVGCLTLAEGSLSVCGYHGNEFGIFRTAPGETSFESELRFADVKSQVACSDGAEVLALCQADFEHWLEEHEPDAAGSGEEGALSTSDEHAHPSGGCNLHPAGAAPSGASALLLAVLYLLRRARERARGRRSQYARGRARRPERQPT